MSKRYTAAQANSAKKYLSGFALFKVRMTHEDKEKYTNAAKAAGISLNTYIIEALESRYARENSDK